MISRIKALMVPLQPAQHLASGLAGQRVSVSVSQHPHTPPPQGMHAFRAARRAPCCWQSKTGHLASLRDSVPHQLCWLKPQHWYKEGAGRPQNLHVCPRALTWSPHLLLLASVWQHVLLGKHRHYWGAPPCEQQAHWGWWRACRVEASRRGCRLFPTGEDILRSVGHGHAAPQPGGLPTAAG